jgi:hypothetical protein
VQSFNIHKIHELDMNSYLRLMYHNLFDKVSSEFCSISATNIKDYLQVVQNQVLLHNKVNINYQSFKSYARRGGHTYMDAHERKKYILLAGKTGAACDILKISVRLLNNDSDDEQERTVWKSIVNVTSYLEMDYDKTVVQGGIAFALNMNHCNEELSYTHCLVGGPMFPMLVCMHLAKIVDGGITICAETFNQKMEANVDISAKEFGENPDLVSKKASEGLAFELHHSMPFVLNRFGNFLRGVSTESFSVNELMSHQIHFTWGLGCTVETLCTQDDSLTSQDTSLFIDVSPTELTYKYLKSCPDQAEVINDSTYGRKLDQAFTVVTTQLPPYAEHRNQPFNWFEGARVSTSILSNGDSDYDSDDTVDESCANTNLESCRLISEKTTMKKKQKNMHPNIAVKCKSHVTYPVFGGLLPFEYQPITIECKKFLKNTSFMGVTDIERVMTYNISSRLACGEYGVDLKGSVELSRTQMDVNVSNDLTVFNMSKCIMRLDSFIAKSDKTLQYMNNHGSPSRIEIAFGSSPNSETDSEDLCKRIKDLLTICITSTQSFKVEPVTSLIRFALLGVTTKLQLVSEMMESRINNPAIYDELLSTRLECAAHFKSWYSGRGKLKNKHLSSPKNAHMACRPIFKKMLEFTERQRETVLLKAKDDLYELFTSKLRDINGTSHHRIEMPLFIRKTEEKQYNEVYHCGKACDKCWKIFFSRQTIASFSTHSCFDLLKGKEIKITDKKFVRHKDQMYSLLKPPQKKLIELIDENKHNVFLTGFAGTGKTKTLLYAIVHCLHKFGMNSFAVIAPTKVAAGLIGGKTYHSFLRKPLPIKTRINGKMVEILRTASEVESDAIAHANDMVLDDPARCLTLKFALRIIFIDEVSMLSHDNLLFMDFVLRHIRQKLNVPFGGIRIILCGDAMQLTPMVSQQTTGRHPEYFFECESFLNGNFKVLYLRENHRQGDNSVFSTLLNKIRLGNVSAEDCDIINSTWGGDVDRHCVEKILEALHKQLNSEVAKIVSEDVHYRFANPHAINNGQKTLLGKLVYKKDCLWNPAIIKSHLDYMYDITTMKHRLNADINLSPYWERTANHIQRLQSCLGNDMYHFVISMENVEVKAISTAYGIARNDLSYMCRAVDSVDFPNVIVDDLMKSFAAEESKLESILEVAINQNVFITVNDLDADVANNQIARIVDIRTNDGEVEEITIVPLLNDENRIGHPIKVIRKLRKMLYLHPTRKTHLNLTREQFPLRAADSGTPHTVEGLTLLVPHVVNNQRASCKGYGAMYVALSRAKESNLVFPLHPLRVEDFAASPLALAFDRYHGDQVTKVVTDVDYTVYPLRKTKIVKNVM